jgi:hypothetical protein
MSQVPERENLWIQDLTPPSATVTVDLADKSSMTNSLPLISVVLAGVVLTLYIMRRRVRMGRRAPKF